MSGVQEPSAIHLIWKEAFLSSIVFWPQVTFLTDPSIVSPAVMYAPSTSGSIQTKKINI
jgi:hypothetical protein